jgi:hypothetical protein
LDRTKRIQGAEGSRMLSVLLLLLLLPLLLLFILLLLLLLLLLFSCLFVCFNPPPSHVQRSNSPMAARSGKGDRASVVVSEYGLHLPSAMSSGGGKESEKSNLVEFKIWDFQGTEAFVCL